MNKCQRCEDPFFTEEISGKVVHQPIFEVADIKVCKECYRDYYLLMSDLVHRLNKELRVKYSRD